MPASSAASTALRLLCVGQSHFGCVRTAAQERQAELARQGVELRVIVMNRPEYEPHFDEGLAGQREPLLNPLLQAQIGEGLAWADTVVQSIGGTAHWLLGLLEHPQPFDFELGTEYGNEFAQALLPGREPVPAALIRATLAHSSLYNHQRILRRFLAERLPRPLAQIESPPPPFDAQHIHRYPGYYHALIGERGVAPAALRHKLWRLHSRMVAEECEALGIDFLPVPKAVKTADGYLVPEALAPDPTHANAWYGRRLIEQIVRRHRPGFALAEAEFVSAHTAATLEMA
jgi:hypothetical protein